MLIIAILIVIGGIIALIFIPRFVGWLLGLLGWRFHDDFSEMGDWGNGIVALIFLVLGSAALAGIIFVVYMILKK